MTAPTVHALVRCERASERASERGWVHPSRRCGQRRRWPRLRRRALHHSYYDPCASLPRDGHACNSSVSWTASRWRSAVATATAAEPWAAATTVSILPTAACARACERARVRACVRAFGWWGDLAQTHTRVPHTHTRTRTRVQAHADADADAHARTTHTHAHAHSHEGVCVYVGGTKSKQQARLRTNETTSQYNNKHA